MSTKADKKPIPFDMGTFFTDKDKESGGVEFPFPGTDASILIARNNNPAFIHQSREGMLTLEAEKRAREDEGNPMSEDEITERLNRLQSENFGANIVLGWKNLVIGGQEIPYSKEMATKLLLKSDDFLNYVWSKSNNADNYLAEVDLEILKN